MPSQTSSSSKSADTVIAVPVTAAWMSTSAARIADLPVTQPVPDMSAWMASLTHDMRLDLLGRISTSALLGEPVIVISEHSGWSEVRLPWQPSTFDPRGYPAWIPSAHIAPSSSVGVASDGDGDRVSDSDGDRVSDGDGDRDGNDGGAHGDRGGVDLDVGGGYLERASGDGEYGNRGGADRVGGGASAEHGKQAEPSVFCVTRRLVPVRANRSGPPIAVLSMGTRLPVVDVDPAAGTNHAQVRVAGARGTYWIDADCGIYASAAAPQRLSSQHDPEGHARKEEERRSQLGVSADRDWNVSELLTNRATEIIAAGSELLGLSYLWGGLSGWGVDCSGLVHLALRSMGFIVPRDSVDQHGVFGSVHGAPVPGHPVFFRYRSDSLRIHHVGLAVSDTTMLHAPQTGRVVEFLPIATEPYGSELEIA